MSAMGKQERLERRGAVHRLLGDRSPDLLVVAGLGSAIWDAETAGETPLNFYLLGAMGSAVPTAPGLATAQPSKRVMALVGDAELAMGLWALATIGWRKPENLTVVCLDNSRSSHNRPSGQPLGRQSGFGGRGHGLRPSDRAARPGRWRPRRTA